jgi:hypothetical protein
VPWEDCFGDTFNGGRMAESVPCSHHVHRLHALYDCHSLICFVNSHTLFVDMHAGFAEKSLPMLWCSSHWPHPSWLSCLLLQCHLK